MNTSDLPDLRKRTLFPGLACLLLLPDSALRAQYGELPLRANLLPDPCFRTEEGRVDKRGADALVNRYRLYDFYRRQADAVLELEPGSRPSLLPPYPGLDGGRRGHWGATNERDTAAVMRERDPDFTTVTGRNRVPQLYVRMNAGSRGPLLVYDAAGGGLRSVHDDAAMSVPLHPFALGADRFGFELAVAGEAIWTAVPDQPWLRSGGKAAEAEGHAVHGDRTVLRHSLAGRPVLEWPLLRILPGGISLVVRQIEFPEGTGATSEFRLPRPRGQRSGGHGGDPVFRDGAAAAFQKIHFLDGLEGRSSDDGDALEITAAPPGCRLVIIGWCGPVERLPEAGAIFAEALAAARAERPSSLQGGGPLRLGPPLIVQGRLCADPEAAGSAYEIDDVPVPGPELTDAPMTLSGLAFAADGTAYASTLVGDVWKITGLRGDLKAVQWKRFASGLNLPLGLVVHNDSVYVNARPYVCRLSDRNGDGEADTYERFSRQSLPGGVENGRDLRRLPDGSFRTVSSDGIWSLSADGSRLDRIGGPARNPFGMGVRPDGLVISDSSEGDSGNGTCTLYESDHAETAATTAKRNRLFYFPRGLDNSPGSRLFMDESRFGPLGRSLVGVSYGNGTWYYLVREVVEGTPQAVLVPLRGQFLSGAARVAVQPADGQLWVAGFDGWGDHATAEGSLHRLRYTGRPLAVLTGWRASPSTLRLDFSEALAAAPAPDRIAVQQWNYLDATHSYGSMEYSVQHPGQPGHDLLVPKSSTLSSDGKSLLLEFDGLRPAMCTQVRSHLTTVSGTGHPLDVYLSLQRLAGDAAAAGELTLAVPAAEENGNTYQKTVEHFDRLAGRTVTSRPVGPEVKWKPEELNFEWIRREVLSVSCQPCHGPGTPHDYSSYGVVRSKVRLEAPERSPLVGMLRTGTMPPYPLPTVSASVQEAVLAWIRRGAPEK